MNLYQAYIRATVIWMIKYPVSSFNKDISILDKPELENYLIQ